jgi:hypothetical protein
MKVDGQASDREKDALKWAIDFFREEADVLRPSGSKAALYESDTLIDMHDNWRNEQPRKFHAYFAELLNASLDEDGDYARFRLSALAAELLERGEPLTGPLKVFVVKTLRRDPIFESPTKRGPRPNDLIERNLCICEAVEHIIKAWKFAPTRNVATQTPSAASIARDALEHGVAVHLSEKAVNKIWNWHEGVFRRPNN